MFDVCVIGHITRDIIRIGNIEKEMPGGAAYYFPMALKNLGSNASLITKAAEKDKYLLNDLIRNDIGIFYRESQETTVFENIYFDNLDDRIQNVKSVAQPFRTEDIPNISTQIFHFGPLTKDDVPLKILQLLSRKAKKRKARISLDTQGFVRRICEGKVTSVDWKEKKKGLACVNILKTDETEAKILSGEESTNEAAARLSSYGIDEIIVTQGTQGSLIYSKGEFYSIPAFPARKIADATGCGDTYLAAYIHKRLKSSDIYESGRFAAATATLKLEESGPFRGTEAEVKSFLETQSI
ncbi:Ribokinase [subsurface metagenome]